MTRGKMLTDWMLKENREYVIKVKAVLLKAIITLALKCYPDPRKEGVNKPNTKFILELEDDFFSHYFNKSRIPLYRAMFRLWGDTLEHDDSHAKNHDYLLMKLHEGILSRRYKLHPPNKYTVYWKE